MLFFFFFVIFIFHWRHKKQYTETSKQFSTFKSRRNIGIKLCFLTDFSQLQPRKLITHNNNLSSVILALIVWWRQLDTPVLAAGIYQTNLENNTSRELHQRNCRQKTGLQSCLALPWQLTLNSTTSSNISSLSKSWKLVLLLLWFKRSSTKLFFSQNIFMPVLLHWRLLKNILVERMMMFTVLRVHYPHSNINAILYDRG